VVVGAAVPGHHPPAIAEGVVATGAAAAVPVAPPPTMPPAAAPPGARHVRRPRLARTQGRPPESEPARRGRRFIKPLAALLSVVIVLFLVGGGGYLATRQLYFIGTNNEGIVTIYRGLPYDLPFGIHLYESYYVSGLPASLVPTDRRATLLNHNLRSQEDAAKLVQQLELGEVSK
jgi:protein phosphatase